MRHLNESLTLILVALYSCAVLAHGQSYWGMCDPLNTNEIFTADDDFYPTLESICTNGPPKPMPINNCGLLGQDFVTYSDATILADGTIQAFAASEDLSQYSSEADVQSLMNVTMPNGQQSTTGEVSFHGFVMLHLGSSFDPNNIGDMLISTRHELNWPGCDGYGTIVLTSATVRIGATVEWFGNSGEIAPSVYAFTPLDNTCVRKTVCGDGLVSNSNNSSGYLKEYRPWISFGGNPVPYGSGEGFCSPVFPRSYTNNPPGGGPYCYDIGVK